MTLKDPILEKFFNLNRTVKRKKSNYRVFDDPVDLKNSEEMSVISDKEVIGDEMDPNKGPIGNQLGSDKGPIGNQLGSNKGPIGNQLGSNWGAIGVQKSNQLVTIDTPYSATLETIGSLYGLQKKLLFYIMESCRNNAALYTKKITIEELKIVLNTTNNAVKTAIQRLINKGIICRQKGKRGKGGHAVFSITETLKDCFATCVNKGSISIQESNQLGCNKVSSQAYTSSRSNLITTTIKDLGITSNANASDELPEVNVTPLEDIGFTEVHVRQLTKDGKLTAEQIQDSIYFFAFDLAHNNKLQTLKKDPLSFFMGILIQGRVYTPPANYESLEAQSLRVYLQHKQREEQAVKELEERLKGIECQAWQEGLSEAELMDFYVPDVSLEGLQEKIRKTMIRRNALNHARDYFELEVWPLRKKTILEKT